MKAEKIATANRPQRQGESVNDRLFQRLADRGNAVIAGQEIPDADAKRLCPKGYRRHRPRAARSEVLYWNPRVWDELGRGALLISSPHAPAPRFIVWAMLQHGATGTLRRFGAVHLVAFKTRDKRHAAEYRHQQERCAEWLQRHPRGVLMGDFNGSFGGHWLTDLEAVGNDHTPHTNSGPDGQNIDLIVTSKHIPRAIHAAVMNDGDGDHKPVEALLPLTKKEKR